MTAGGPCVWSGAPSTRRGAGVLARLHLAAWVFCLPGWLFAVSVGPSGSQMPGKAFLGAQGLVRCPRAEPS